MSDIRLIPGLPLQPVIGMVHLGPLVGAPRHNGSLQQVRDRAVSDAEALAQGGVDAIMIENFGDAPFYPGPAPPETIAQMAAIATAVSSAVDLPLGINVLRNDGVGALAVALACGAVMVRINVLVGARVTDQGLIEGRAHEVMRMRARLAPGIAVLADVDVKHSAPLAPRALADEVADLVGRGGPDAVIVSGSRTGQPTSPDDVTRVRALCAIPVLVGSGVHTAQAAALRDAADGFIVGTAFQRDGRVDADSVASLTKMLRARRTA